MTYDLPLAAERHSMPEILERQSMQGGPAEIPLRAASFDGDAVRRDLASLARAHARQPERLRTAALASVRGGFTAARERIRKNLEAGVMPGLAAARALSALQDDVIVILIEFATRHFFPSRGSTDRLCIAATGGYGRGLLAPFSDVDLLFLVPEKAPAWCENVTEFVLVALWDLGLKAGHATRTPAECIELAQEDMTIRTALMEARFLLGDRALFDEFSGKFWKDVASGNGRDFVEAKLEERDTRHIRQGESRYLVEPNLKEGKGGLRDLQTLYWIGKYLYRVQALEDLMGQGVFTPEEFRTFQKAEAFLWDVRCHLHYVAGRAEERISFDLQPALARAMGYDDKEAYRAVERFMRNFFLVAKDVGDLTRIFCAMLEEQNRKTRPGFTGVLSGLRFRPDDDFGIDGGRLAARAGLFEKNPVDLIRLFHLADAKAVDIHPTTLHAVTRSLDRIDDRLRENAEANRLFLEIVSSRHHPEQALRRMNEAGVLGRFLPEFGHVVALMQFNMYHHYTVDEHTLHAIGNLAAIERGERRKDHPLASDLIKRVKAREALYLAMLLHDTAKGRPGDHSEQGAVLAGNVCLRLGIAPADREDVVWLVRNHLLMSDVAQRRDVGDPQTVKNFVRAVQSPERLRLLLLLTVADIRAVGPGVWNGWKGQLLRELYAEAEALISAGDATPVRTSRIAEAKEALAARLRHLPRPRREHALSRHLDSYWLAFDTEAHERHARLMTTADDAGETVAVDARSDDFRAVTEIIIYTRDHPGLFSQLAGAISVSRGNIVDAKFFATADGFALDVFSVQDTEGGPFGDAARVARLKRTIAKTLAGDILPRDVLAQRLVEKRASAFRVSPRVLFDNEASVASSVVEVEGADRPGLLYELTRALFESGLGIASAIIATYGERVVDVFYVRDQFGHKITHPERIAAVEARLLASLEGRAAAGA
ncbi:MAG: [protein-PII] uridylyltransferase [Alphaproteobacteria bacterium]